MPDELTPAAPAQGAPAASPTQATPASSPPEATPKAPESLPPSPKYLTSDEASALFREQLTQFAPEFVNQLKQQMAGDFASKSEIQKVTQSAADKTYAKMMKQLAPEMRGIDKAVSAGYMDAEQAKNAKMHLLTDAASKMDAEEPADTTAQQPAPQPQPQNTFNPADILRQETSKAAQRILNKAGLTWDNVRAELNAYRASQGRDMPLEEFNEMVTAKMVEKGTQGKETEWMKNYEAKVTASKNADKGGAMTPPPPGASPDYKPKPTLDDANDIGDVLIKHYPQLSQQ